MKYKIKSAKHVLQMSIIISVIFLIEIPTATSKMGIMGVRGLHWQKLDNNQKLLFLSGLFDGLYFADNKIDDEKVEFNTSLDHISRAIDQFYEDYRNELIPVSYSIKVISMELSGKSSEAIEKEIKLLRKLFYDL